MRVGAVIVAVTVGGRALTSPASVSSPTQASEPPAIDYLNR
jgi:hypothetical protein